MRYYFTPVRMAIIKKSTSDKCWRESGEKEALLHCGWECNLVWPLWKTVWSFLKKLKLELPCDRATSLLDMLSGENSYLKRYMHPNVHSSTIYNSQDMEATKVSIDRWMDKKENFLGKSTEVGCHFLLQ